ncbi:MAG: NAD-dependent epimerase/dehydratase family protein [Gammaproteobacteria bacterium]|nr:NAD-dependent epimerase/dehydratase family protein [Gammaproteobacteria bacterium]
MRVLVTGAGGFLGGAIARALHQRGDEVISFQRGDYPGLRTLGIQTYRGDIADSSQLNEASNGCDALIHVAAKAGVWGDYQEYYRSNVTATLKVIAACRKNTIPRLVYTSSPSIVFAGEDEDGIDESTPFPEHYLTNYQRTKAEAEEAVLAANTADLASVALRPHLVFGPGDPHLAPRIIERARKGRLRLVGNRENLVDITYIDNAVSAHLLALDALQINASCAGKAYFISNGEPLPMAEIVNRILKAADLDEVRKSISARSAYIIGSIMEFVYSSLKIKSEPVMTRFIARQLSCSHWYDISAARRDLNYEPLISIDEGMENLQNALRNGHEMA